jgi:hypothetical protein
VAGGDAETLMGVAMGLFEGLRRADRISEGASVMQAMRPSVKETSMGGGALCLAISTGNWQTTAGAIYCPTGSTTLWGISGMEYRVRCREERKRNGKHAFLAEVLRYDRSGEIIVCSSIRWNDSERQRPCSRSMSDAGNACTVQSAAWC